MNTDVVIAARTLASWAHAGQVDKQGRDYFGYHLKPVADLLAPFGPFAIAAGWLHDVLEDTDVTVEDLVGYDFPGPVILAVVAVTRKPGELYMDRIRKIGMHRLATIVKLADNWVNLTGLDDLARRPGRAADAERLRARYVSARALLEAALAYGDGD